MRADLVQSASVRRHYSRQDTEAAARALLEDGSRDALTSSALSSFDQLHARGFDATVEMAEALSISCDDLIIDLGAGLGGPARYLANRYNCTVVGVDLTPSFVRAASTLANSLLLGGHVSFVCGSALELSFPDQAFDIVWTQHAVMNIANRPRFYKEARRVLRAGGKFACYDVLEGGSGPVHFPVPWAREPETSFLMSPDAMQSLLSELGFRQISWIDKSSACAAWYERLASGGGAGESASRPATHLSVGADFRQLAAGMAGNIADGRAIIVQAVYERE
jgi:ubiquinone/menaquinone biosynthesis C-methylase UbiE